VWRDKVNYPDLKAKIIDLYARYSAQTLLIEDQGNGLSLIQELRTFGIPAVAMQALRDKAFRLVSSTSYMESGQLWLPADAPWLATFEAELLGFPNTRHDDQVDSLSQYFSWVRQRGEDQFIVHHLYEQEDAAPETLMDILASMRGSLR
jgi:predicted phage terminase large subunit-like protein